MSAMEGVVAYKRRGPDSRDERREGGCEERKQTGLPSLLTGMMIILELTREKKVCLKWSSVVLKKPNI